jgi:hypothetical protein
MKYKWSKSETGKKQQGFLLPVVFSLLFVLLLMSATRLYLSRHNLNTTQRLSDRERAYQVAASGIETVRQSVERTFRFINNPSPKTFPKRDKAPEECSEIILALLDDDGLFKDGEISMPVSSGYIKFIAGVSDAKQLIVELTLSEGRKMSPPSYTSLMTDEREKSRLLSITATAEVGKSTCRVTTFKQLKLVNITPPLIGKFALFLHDPGIVGTNGLDDSSSPDKIKNSPLTIYGGSKATVSSIEPSQWGQFIDNQGWIYLGSNSNWVLGASKGGGREDSMEGLLKTDVFTYPLERGSYLDSMGSIAYYSRQEYLFRELGESSEQEVLALKSKNDYRMSSLLNLAGSNGNETPTLVLGNVFRRWVLIQGLKNSNRNTLAPLPCLDKSTFESSQWPGRAKASTIETIKRHFENSYQKYCNRMSNLVEEPFNRANLATVLFPTDDENRVISGDYSGLGTEGTSLPKSTKISSRGESLEFHKLANLNTITLKNDEGITLAENCPLSDISDYSFLTEKAAILYESYDDFLADQRLEEKGLSLKEGLSPGGVIHINSDIEFNDRQIVHRGSGGIILCSGNITIKDAISCEGDEPLTLLSIGGNISIETNKEIDAALIALNGVIYMGNTCNVYGLVAAKSMKLPESINSEKRSITYNKAFDPTNYDNYKRNFRITVEKRWKSFVH